MEKQRNLCQLGELGLSCIGCCGFEFTDKKEVIEALDKNTAEFEDFFDMAEFRDRHPKDILRISGICYNLAWKDKGKGIIFCPLHPDLPGNKGKDLREGHCHPEHLCRTAHEFSRWSMEKQDRFIRFLRSKDMDWYEYSISIDDGSLLDEFEKKNV